MFINTFIKLFISLFSFSNGNFTHTDKTKVSGQKLTFSTDAKLMAWMIYTYHINCFHCDPTNLDRAGSALTDFTLLMRQTWSFNSYNPFSILVTLGSLGFILSCSLQVCGQNIGQHISMGRHKSLEKESIYQEKHAEKNDRWESREILSFFFSKWDQTQHPLLAFFSSFILSRDWSRQILSEHAVLVLIQSTKKCYHQL